MSKTDYVKCSIFFVMTFGIVLIHLCTSAPINVTENVYTQFVIEFNRNKCSLPSQVQLPFDTTKVNNIEYFSSYLDICQKTESTKRNKEAVVLCKEIFDNIKNISCPTKTALPDDISVNLSENVCEDMSALKDYVPKDDKSLLQRLTDSFLCDIMCDSEFEKACQVLLWSFKVQKLIASIASAQELELPNLPEDGKNLNVDILKQDGTVDGDVLPENSVDLENGKNAENVNVVGHDGISGASKQSNPEQIDVSAISNEKEKIEQPLSNDKEAIFKISKDSIGSSKATSIIKESNTVTQPSTQISNSNNESGNTKKQLQSDVTKYFKVNAEGEGLDADVATNGKTHDINDNALVDRTLQDKKDTTTLANRSTQYNSNNLANQNIPVDGEGNIPGNEIPHETPEKGQNSNILNINHLSHESANEKSPNDVAVDLHNEQNPFNFVNTLGQNKLQKIMSNDDNLAKTPNFTNINGQIIKDTTQQQTVLELPQDKTSIYRDDIKADPPQTDSVLRKTDETQDQKQFSVITHDLITDDRTKNSSTNGEKIKVVQQTEELNNTIPDTTETLISSDKKPPENSWIVNLDESAVPSTLMETSTKILVALEKMEGHSDIRQPADQGDHYEDTENIEGEEYMGPDHGENGINEVSIHKDSHPDVPGSVTAAKEIIISQNEKPMEFPSRNAFGQDSNDIQMISPFPEQEDGHFFFYFLSFVLIIMAGYLIFHNKQKIIALIVEGRHERNRRSHRIGYKKLETK